MVICFAGLEDLCGIIMFDWEVVRLALRVFNTLSGKKERIQPRDPERISIYICGITPYSNTHLGHARPSVFWDTVIRYLKYTGYEVHAVQNVTDVNEKVLARAELEGVSERQLAEKFNDEYEGMMQKLNVRPLDEYPWVSDHIEDIVKFIQKLIDEGHAYQVEGDVYFSVESFPRYGQLSGQSPEDLISGARIEVDERKKHPADFALWKEARPEEPAWESPWGAGRPGWHIECSALAIKYLGFGFDFHGGGTDLIFPHHENEIAQSEAAWGDRPFVRYWVHHGMVRGEEGKMSKSLGNFVTVRDILAEYRPEVVRHFLLSAHYSTPLTFSEKQFSEIETAWRRFYNAMSSLRGILDGRPREDVPLAEEEARELGETAESIRDEFCRAMDDDFNTPEALAAVFDGVRKVNGVINAPDFVLSGPVLESLQDIFDQLEVASRILGIWPKEGLYPEEAGSDAGRNGGKEEELLNLLIEVRNQVRQEKMWAVADHIRDSLEEMGFKLEDTPRGTRIKRSDPCE